MLVDIIKRNRATFRDNATGERVSLLFPNAIKWIVAIIIGFLFGNIKDNFLSAALAIYSILLGFSFNVLFFISQAKRNDMQSMSLEARSREQRLSTLLKEIFHNVSYFNFASIVLVIFLSMTYVPSFFSLRGISISNKVLYLLKKYDQLLGFVSKIGDTAFDIVLYFLLIESMYTFARITYRISYFFEERMSR